MTAVLGIDYATQRAKVGLALGELRTGVVRITKCRTASRTEPPAQIAADWLSAYDCALVALDAPLGWARALGASLRRHRAGAPMNAKSDELFRRATDVNIRQRMGKRPLEVGVNLISRTAVAALELLEAIRQLTGHTIPLAWAPDEAVPYITEELFPLLRDLVDDAVLVSDDAVKASMRRLVTANKMIAEPSGALALAAALASPDEKRGLSVCIVTGGSIDPRKLAAILGDTQRVEA